MILSVINIMILSVIIILLVYWLIWIGRFIKNTKHHYFVRWESNSHSASYSSTVFCCVDRLNDKDIREFLKEKYNLKDVGIKSFNYLGRYKGI